MQKFSKIQKKQFDDFFWNRSIESEIEKGFYKKTRKYLKFIAWIPWLKMVWIGNSISMNSASKKSDIDLLIVSTNNSMWLVRILVTAIFQVLWVRKTAKKHAERFCLSFFCTLDGLSFEQFALDNDPYLFFWIIYFKPILNYDNTYNLFLEKNKAWADFREYGDIFEKNKKYIKYSHNIVNRISSEIFFIIFLNNIFKKVFLPKTLTHYKRIWKPFWVLIHKNVLKFHNGDVRKKISKLIL